MAGVQFENENEGKREGDRKRGESIDAAGASGDHLRGVRRGILSCIAYGCIEHVSGENVVP